MRFSNKSEFISNQITPYTHLDTGSLALILSVPITSRDSQVLITYTYYPNPGHNPIATSPKSKTHYPHCPMSSTSNPSNKHFIFIFICCII